MAGIQQHTAGEW